MCVCTPMLRGDEQTKDIQSLNDSHWWPLRCRQSPSNPVLNQHTIARLQPHAPPQVLQAENIYSKSPYIPYQEIHIPCFLPIQSPSEIPATHRIPLMLLTPSVSWSIIVYVS